MPYFLGPALVIVFWAMLTKAIIHLLKVPFVVKVMVQACVLWSSYTSVHAFLAYSRKKEVEDDDGETRDDGDIYGLSHWRLNIKVPAETMWMNMGYWETATSFPVACESLLLQVLETAGIISPVSQPGNLIPTPEILQSGISILDLGFGCGDQTLCLAQLDIPSASRAPAALIPVSPPLTTALDQKTTSSPPSTAGKQHSLTYIGLTLNRTQYRKALSRLRAIPSFQSRNLKLFCANAADPTSWKSSISAAVNAGFASDITRAQTLKTPTCPTDPGSSSSSNPPEKWVLALDTLYHFHPSRLPILTHAYQTLRANVMAFDLILSPDITPSQRFGLRLSAMAAGCPAEAFVSRDDYVRTFEEAGYRTQDVVIRDVTQFVFAPLARFMEERERELKAYGLGLGGLGIAKRLFRWWAGGKIVQGVVVVARR